MRLQAKLMLAPLVTAVLILLAGLAANFLSVTEVRQAHVAAQNDHQVFQAAAEVQLRVAAGHAGAFRLMALVSALDDASFQRDVKLLEAQLAGTDAALNRLAQLAGLPADAKVLMGESAGLNATYKKQVHDALDLASVDPNTGVAAMQTAEGSFQKLNASIGHLMQLLEAQNATTSQQQLASSTRVAVIMALVVLAVAGGGAAVLFRVQRRVVADIQDAVRVVDSVAAGDLTHAPRPQGQDEVADLLRNLGQMCARLRESLSQVLSASDSIRTASAEIAAGNQDLSRRTEQAASSLQQTSSSMASLMNVVQETAQGAGGATGLASTAVAVAEQGGTAVREVVGTMAEISDSSRRIADIIGTIDGIAFQTNILALNAAVEAARAGEQGRGFAVVAGEVRALAGRSAEAAREIKSLIGASVERVESGGRQVQAAGGTMDEIVQSIGRVASMIDGISRGASAQNEGLSAISTSVSELDQMTQQNAALVEQSAAAAESLRQQAEVLSRVVSGFRVQ